MPISARQNLLPDQMHILMVEDSPRLGPLLTEVLRDAGYSIDLATTAQDFDHFVSRKPYALYIVDLGLPDEDGLKLISRLRAGNIHQPILVITARVGLDDRISGLDLGADDFLVKPFNQRELLARIRALLRRPLAIAPSTRQVSRLTLDVQTQDIVCDGQIVSLTPGEHRLLSLFLRRGSRIVTADDIEQISNDQGREVSGNAVQQAISRLRKQLQRLDPDLRIQTIRGSGYKLEVAE